MVETHQDPALGPEGLNGAGLGNGNGGVAVATDAATSAPWARTPRNAPCPCGSGKKYKHCHGRV